MIRLVTYAAENMTIAQDLCIRSALKHGVDDFDRYGPRDINAEFFQFNQEILTQERGVGYWLWKPYVIYKSLQGMKDGDYLLYADSGVEFVNSIQHLFPYMEQDIFLFTNTHPQFHWCKEETSIAMGVSEPPIGLGQVQASVILLKVNEKTRAFIKRWLLWCQMPGLIDDSKWLPQRKEFQDHRHDQAILTILAYQAGYKLHWWPTQYSEHIRVAGDNYPVLFNHHRKRNQEFV